MDKNDSRALADFCKENLDLTTAGFDDEYQSLPLCVIDAVFSIGVKYASTENTVKRFCEYFGFQRLSRVKYPDISTQLSIADFVKLYDNYGIDWMTEQVYQNRQRTSTRSGILKSEAALRFSETLLEFGVYFFQDIDNVIGDPNFETAIKKIPGQGSGISLRYFYMLAGSDDYIKPDRMMARFIWSALNKSLSVEETHRLVVETCKILAAENPLLTPRSLDHAIWQYQRTQ